MANFFMKSYILLSVILYLFRRQMPVCSITVAFSCCKACSCLQLRQYKVAVIARSSVVTECCAQIVGLRATGLFCCPQMCVSGRLIDSVRITDNLTTDRMLFPADVSQSLTSNRLRSCSSSLSEYCTVISILTAVSANCQNKNSSLFICKFPQSHSHLLIKFWHNHICLFMIACYNLLLFYFACCEDQALNAPLY